MSAYEGSKMQERDENLKKNITFGKTSKQQAEQRLTDKIVEQFAPAEKRQSEKMELVYEQAVHVPFHEWKEWMNEKGYFIAKF
jgi:hypothetical protein